MEKINYTVDIINARKIDTKKLIYPNTIVEIEKYQNKKNKTYAFYRPISKIINL